MTHFDNFDQYVEEAMKSWHCPGVALVIIKDGEIIHKKAYGLRDVENNLPLTVDTRFPMASITKSFTAMSLALLVDEGKLEWDKPVREYMPEFILKDPYVTANITVRDMLSHRTGLPRHDFSAFRLNITLAEYIKRMRHLEFSTTFRDKFQYNNLMYYASAYLVEKIADIKWEDFIQKRVLDPLRMNSSNFEPNFKGKENALGYRTDRNNEGKFKNLIHIPFGGHTELSPGAAGALFSTLDDMTNWLKVHMNNGQFDEQRLIGIENLREMQKPQIIYPTDGINEALLGDAINTYGMGWFIDSYKNHKLIHHSGGVEGHTLIIGFLPQANIGVIVLTNLASNPLKDALFYECLDCATGVLDTDWNAKFHKVYDPLIISISKSKQTTEHEKIKNTFHTHALDQYTGVFANDGYPDFAIRLEGDQLQACLIESSDWSRLEHYQYNIFEWNLADFDIKIKAHFLMNDQGEIDKISIPLEPMVSPIQFKRKPLELSQEKIELVLGAYNPSVEGMKFEITTQEGKVYMSQTGLAPKEIEPYKATDECIGFKEGDNRLDFAIKNGEVEKLSFKTIYMTLEAVKEK